MAYKPKPNTEQHLILEHLRALGPGVEISCQQAAAVAGRPNASGLRSALREAIAAGFITVRQTSARYSWYRLGDGKPLQPDDDSDSDVRRLSAAAVPSIFAYAQQRNAAAFSTLESSDGRLVLQRDGRVIAELTPKEAEIHREFLRVRGRWEMAEE
jgi:hypothetical protein